MGNAETNEIAVVFGKVLRNARAERGITQEELAFRAGVDRTFIYRIERGIRQPTISTIIGLAQALGISSGDLVSQVESNYLATHAGPQ